MNAGEAPHGGAPEVIALFGPTGLGKTEIAIELAQLLRESGEFPVAVSVDSMQVYSELPVITGAPTQEQQARLAHRLVAVKSVTETHDVVTHARLAHAAIDEVRAAGGRAIVVGGTGLYLRAALTDLDFLPPPPPGTREDLEREAAREGTATLYARLVQADPDYAATVDATNTRRVIRALEAIAAGASHADRDENRLWTSDTRVPTRLFALIMDRERLYERIDRRVDEMVTAGARAEVSAALARGMSQTARQALGVEELSTQQADSVDIEALKTNTRRYAKRQLTWLRKLSGATEIDVTGLDAPSVAADIAARATG